MSHSSFTPGAISRRLKFPTITRSKIIKFFREAYQLGDEPAESHHSARKSKESFLSVGKRANKQ